MRRRAVLKAGGLALAGVVAGCLGGSAAAAVTVEMTDGLAFEPAEVAVTTGGTVTWVNAGTADHTVTAYGADLPDGAAYFASGGYASEIAARRNVSGGLIGADGEYRHTFEQPGRHGYFCIPHESTGMIGSVRVR